MTETYKPNGRPLTDREREILTVLIEECCEVGQAACKLLRFGKENRPVDGLDNITVLSKEVGDLRYMLTMARDAGLTVECVELQQQSVKHDRMRWYISPIRRPKQNDPQCQG